jgi:hypothetical protein
MWEHNVQKCLFNGTAHLKNVNNCLNANIYSYLETSGGQICTVYLNVVHFFQCQCLLDICGSLRQRAYCSKVFIQWNSTLKNVNNCLNANIYSYLETSGGQNCNVYLNVVHFLNASVY